MEFINLASSSSGNAYYISLERKDLPPVKLMLEVGLPYDELQRKAVQNGINLADMDAFLITHGHNDHCRAMKPLLERNRPVWANSALVTANKGNPARVLTHNEYRFIAAETKVLPFSVEHDAEDPLGFIISTDVETILFVNDCKFFTADISKIPFDYIFIEANYDGQVIHFAYEEAKKENDVSNIKRYERLINSHLSIRHTIDILKKLNLSQCKAVFLMHLSDRHANENLFKSRCTEEIGIRTFVCKKHGGIL